VTGSAGKDFRVVILLSHSRAMIAVCTNLMHLTHMCTTGLQNTQESAGVSPAVILQCVHRS
jgi:hypothetical protein